MTILAFWRAHPQYWISIGGIQKEADALITDLYFKQNIEDLDWRDAVIYLDQFMRHFSRVPSTDVTELDVSAARARAVDIVKSHMDELTKLDETELMFMAMPLKHTLEFQTIFEIIHSWLPCGAALTDYPILHRFYCDTYKKAYLRDDVDLTIVDALTEDVPAALDPDIFESCPPIESWAVALDDAADAEPLMRELRDAAVDGVLWVSLSGGVDSNVMCALAKRAGLDVRAIHIVYGNRTTAEKEATFLTKYCAALSIPLYIYRIEWLRRVLVDRAFYESTTRELRFAVYKAVGAAGGVCLGHIMEDVVENVWTNFAHGAHLENLAKMSAAEMENGVRVLRPWLRVTKSTIYKVATALQIPHLKNTTPTWSNRGKFRAGFYPATHAQYGADVDKKVLEVAHTLRSQSEMLDRLLFQPVFNSWGDGVVDVTPIFTAGGLDAHGWLRVLTYFCHNRLGVSKPSIHACRDLSSRLARPFEAMKMPLKGGLVLHFEKLEGRVIMKFLSP